MMLTRCNKLLAVLLAGGLTITTFGSDFYCAKVWAADEEIVETQSEEPAVEEEASNDESTDESFASDDQDYEESYEVEESTSEETGYEEYTEEAEYTEEVTEVVSEETTEEQTLEDELSEELTEEAEKELTEEELAALAALEAEKTEAVVVEEKETAEYPAQSFNDSVAGMNVSVEAEEGAFPEGTTMKLSAISDSQAVSAAEDALDGEVKEAKGVDISFADSEGNEIEPKGAVRVSISLADSLEGDSFSVVHLDDNGNSEMVAGASSNGADFTADAFSIYIVAGLTDNETEDQKYIATYEFYYDNGDGLTLFNTQYIEDGGKLQDPGNPIDKFSGKIFLGWIETDDNGNLIPFPYNFDEAISVTETKTHKIYAGISSPEFVDNGNGAFSLTFTVVTGTETKVITISSQGFVKGEYHLDLVIDGEKVYVDPAYCDYIREHVELICQGAQITCAFIEFLISIADPKDVIKYPTSITYDNNYDPSVTTTVDLEVNQITQALTEEQAAALGISREGFRLAGWSKVSGANNNDVFALPGESIVADNENTPNVLYAVWTSKGSETIEEPDPTPVNPPADEQEDDPKEEDPKEDPTPSDPEVTPETPASEDPTPSTPATEDPADPADPVVTVTPSNDTVEAPAADPAPAVESAAVLGERKSDDLPAVLGARRASTEDTTNDVGRVIAIIVSLLAAAGLVVLGKKKYEV